MMARMSWRSISVSPRVRESAPPMSGLMEQEKVSDPRSSVWTPNHPRWRISQCGTMMAAPAQANGENSDTYLQPVKMYPCPFTKGDNLLVMCETYNHENEATATNKRKKCAEVMKAAASTKPWFGIEQEYTL